MWVTWWFHYSTSLDMHCRVEESRIPSALSRCPNPSRASPIFAGLLKYFGFLRHHVNCDFHHLLCSLHKLKTAPELRIRINSRTYSCSPSCLVWSKGKGQLLNSEKGSRRSTVVVNLWTLVIHFSPKTGSSLLRLTAQKYMFTRTQAARKAVDGQRWSTTKSSW